MSDDADEFREWVVTTSPRLVRTAVLLTGDRHLAEDLVQNTLMRVWPRWQQVRTGYPEVLGDGRDAATGEALAPVEKLEPITCR